MILRWDQKKEISEQIGLSVSSVKMQVKRTLEQLRFSLLAVNPFVIPHDYTNLNNS